MRLRAGHSVMDNWPLEQKFAAQTMARVWQDLSRLGISVWESGQILIPLPFSSGSLRGKAEGWHQGLVIRFPDAYSPTVIPWHELQAIDSKAGLQKLLVTFSHPLRFSPYHLTGAGRLFIGREAELALLMSGLDGLVISGQSGTGKTSLLLKGANNNGGGFVNCQGFGYRDLELRLTGLARSGFMSQLLFLDELDCLIPDPRTTRLLALLNRKGIAWRISVHQRVPGLGPHLELGAPRDLAAIFRPLEQISGAVFPCDLRNIVVSRVENNIGRAQVICHLILQEMGPRVRAITSALVNGALNNLEGERVGGERAV